MTAACVLAFAAGFGAGFIHGKARTLRRLQVLELADPKGHPLRVECAAPAAVRVWCEKDD